MDVGLYELRKDGELLALRPKVFDLLRYFVEHRGRVLGKSELLSSLWPGLHVTPQSVTVLVAEARRALGLDRKSDSCIKTVYGRGYRFTAEVEVEGGVVAPAAGEAEMRLSVPALPVEEATHRGGHEHRAERKLATVVAILVRILGATAGAEDTEELFLLQHRLQTRIRKAVVRYGGRIYGQQGLQTMAVFGVPRACDDHAWRAALAASALLADGGDLADVAQLRVGIHSGAFIVGVSGGSDAGLIMTPVGDSITRAQELAERAAAGTIVVSNQARARLGPGAPLAALADAQSHVLGVITPERRGWSNRHGDDQNHFVGRAAELAFLHGQLEHARQGHGRTVAVVGEAGIGKSRLLRELGRSLAHQNVRRVSATCAPPGCDKPYGAVVGLLRDFCSITASEEPGTAKLKVFRALVASGVWSESACELLCSFLGIGGNAARASTTEVSALSAGEEQVCELSSKLILSGCAPAPLVIEVEDLHWIDSYSERWLVALVARIVLRPVLLLTTSRCGCVPPWRERSTASQITLAPLDTRASRRIIDDVGGRGKLGPMLVERIIRRADGNPLFLEELARSACERSAARAEDDLPVSVLDVLAARIDSLDAPAKRLLQVCAVLGQRVHVHILRALLEVSDQEVEQSLATLTEGEFLVRDGTDDEAIYVFKHALTQEAAHASLLSSDRRALHERTAELLSSRFAAQGEAWPADVARHWEKAGRRREALAWWRTAGEEALSRFAGTKAAAHLQRALAHLDAIAVKKERDREELALLGGRIRAMLCSYSSGTDLGPAVERAGDLAEHLEQSTDLVPTLCALALGLTMRMDARDGVRVARRGLRLAERTADEPGICMARMTLGISVCFGGRLDEALTHLKVAEQRVQSDACRDVGRRLGLEPAIVVPAFAGIAHVLTGDMTAAQDCLARSRRNARATMRPEPLSELLALMAEYLCLVEARSPSSLKETVHRLRGVGDALDHAAYREPLELLADIAACWNEGRALAPQAERIGALVGTNPFAALHGALCMGDLFVQRNEVELGIALLQRVLDEVEQYSSPRLETTKLLFLLGNLLMNRTPEPDWVQAQDWLTRSVEGATNARAGLWELRGATSLAKVHTRRGARAEAERLLARTSTRHARLAAIPEWREAHIVLEGLRASGRGRAPKLARAVDATAAMGGKAQS